MKTFLNTYATLVIIGALTILSLLTSSFTINPIGNNPSNPKINSANLDVNTTITNTYCNGCIGAIDLTVTGGQEPYEYIWENGASTEDINDLCLGFYEYTVTDALGCTATGGHFVDNTVIPDVILESQADVDAYVSDFSFCTSVINNLQIGVGFAQPLSDITDISGLSFITSVGSNLLIFRNPNLSSLNGLQQITNIGGSVNITDNSGLSNLVGFPDISTINGSLTIDNCTGLTSLEGLNQITSVNGNKFYLAFAADLTDISALSNLETVNGDLDIRICLDLTNLDGLENLNSVGGDLILRDHPMLTDIAALNHPISIGENLSIENIDLSLCSVEAVCNHLQMGGNATISNNNTGCNSSAEITSACTTGDSIDVAIDLLIPTCFGDCDGSISAAVVAGGTPPFQYLWSTGDTTQQITGLCEDIYSLTITDSENQSFSSSLVLLAPPLLQVQISEVSPDCFESCNGEISVFITGGNGPYTFDTPSNICGNTEYPVTVTDILGCTAIEFFTVPGSVAIDLTVDSIGDAISGLDNGFINISISGGSAPLNFNWKKNGTTVSTDEDLENLSPGDYTLTIIDNFGCSIVFGPYTVDELVSTEVALTSTSFNVYPSPARDFIQIDFSATIPSTTISFSLWNSTGSLCKAGRMELSNNTSLHVEKLPRGIYYLKIKMDDQIQVQKIILQ